MFFPLDDASRLFLGMDKRCVACEMRTEMSSNTDKHFAPEYANTTCLYKTFQKFNQIWNTYKTERLLKFNFNQPNTIRTSITILHVDGMKVNLRNTVFTLMYSWAIRR